MSVNSQAKKVGVIADLIEARRRLLDAAGALPPEKQGTAFLGGWLVKDLLAHLIGWDGANREAAQAVLAGRLPEFYAHYDRDWRTFNAGLVARYRQDDFAALLAAAEASHRELVAALQAVPAEAFDKDVGLRFKGWIVTIHLSRIGQPGRVFTEGFVSDDGLRLKTFSVVPPQHRLAWSSEWQAGGLIPAGRVIASAEKTLFYRECFAVMTRRDEAGALLGHYCDIVTPLEKCDGGYFLTDLILDLWVAADGRATALDGDEFERAVADGLLSPELESIARRTLARLQDEAARGVFPGAYL